MTNAKTTVLVTGGTGFVGIHCVLQLLQQGYAVKTTLRSLKRKEEVLAMLATGGITDFSHLSFVEADLTRNDNWDQAVSNCTYVLHVASPIFLRTPKDENEMITPAVEGTVRVLKAARNAGVQRVVLTSSFGAVGYSQTDPHTVITEANWTNPQDKTLSAYLKSKTLAERAAWDFMAHEGGTLELTVINPMGIFGPALGPAVSSGFEVIRQMLTGQLKALPKITFGIVDVRDVADLHLKAMVHPAAAGQRFLALAGGVMTLHDIALLLKKEFGTSAARVSTRQMPDWLVRIASLFSPAAKAVVPQLGQRKNASNAKAKKLLGWAPRANEEAIIATADSLFRFGTVDRA